ncbi:MAG: phosphatase PAP2 family protein [candidate division KSB1 bacterium]|nr:phosphatase PAP2 family protein [candidate division KSB1 bacterium]
MNERPRSRLIANLRSSDQKWKIYVFIGVVIYFILINQVIHVRPDHAFLALVILAFLLGKEKAKRFLTDWSPFIFFWIAYDMMRGVADSIRGTINVVLPYKVELILFGSLFGGQIPCFWFQDVQKALDGSVFKALVDLLCANMYTIHFAAPLLLGWIFWHTCDDRKMYYRFVYTLTVLNVMALITFMAYPAAPPWYVYKIGFNQPGPNADYWGISAGSLINVDRLLGVKFFTTLWDSFNPNHFAAIPSLHGAYPVVISFFAYKKFKKYPIPLIVYPALTWFAAVYLNQHYIIDLIIGVIYFAVAYQVEERVLLPGVFNKFLDKVPEQKLVREVKYTTTVQEEAFKEM